MSCFAALMKGMVMGSILSIAIIHCMELLFEECGLCFQQACLLLFRSHSRQCMFLFLFHCSGMLKDIECKPSLPGMGQQHSCKCFARKHQKGSLFQSRKKRHNYS